MLESGVCDGSGKGAATELEGSFWNLRKVLLVALSVLMTSAVACSPFSGVLANETRIKLSTSSLTALPV